MQPGCYSVEKLVFRQSERRAGCAAPETHMYKMKKAPDYYPELLMVTRARIELALQP